MMASGTLGLVTARARPLLLGQIVHEMTRRPSGEYQAFWDSALRHFRARLVSQVAQRAALGIDASDAAPPAHDQDSSPTDPVTSAASVSIAGLQDPGALAGAGGIG